MLTLLFAIEDRIPRNPETIVSGTAIEDFPRHQVALVPLNRELASRYLGVTSLIESGWIAYLLY